MTIRDLVSRLLRWAKIPKKSPGEPTCIVCGCTEMAACPGGCGWEHLNEETDYGLCTACAQDRLCAVGYSLMAHAVDGIPWDRVKACPCPLCAGGKGKV